MGEMERFYRLLHAELIRQKLDLAQTESELTELERQGAAGRSIVIKKIKGKLYYYMQWKENGKNCWKYLGPVKPGVVSDEERKIQRYRELLRAKREQETLVIQTETALERLHAERRKERIVEDYSFEVFWKDEITARVMVNGSRVQVARYVEHPLKQLFADKDMSRNQLNRVFELRCWDRNRPDIMDLLKGLGMTEYIPSEIVRRTHGVSYNDYIWFRFPGERLTSHDVLVR